MNDQADENTNRILKLYKKIIISMWYHIIRLQCHLIKQRTLVITMAGKQTRIILLKHHSKIRIPEESGGLTFAKKAHQADAILRFL